jgi:hypothetical protein
MPRSLLLIGLACAAGCAHAEVYKHVDAQGRITYSDQPPADDTVRTEQIATPRDEAAVAPHWVDGLLYCGNVYVTSRNEIDSRSPRLAERRTRIDAELQDARGKHAALSRGAGGAQVERAYRQAAMNAALARLRELECAAASIDEQMDADGGM